MHQKKSEYFAAIGQPISVRSGDPLFESAMRKIHDLHFVHHLTYVEIATLWLMPETSVGRTIRQTRTRMYRSDALRALAIRPPERPAGLGATIDATATRRRLQALFAEGFDTTWQALALGLDRANMHRLMTAEHVTWKTADKVKALYDSARMPSDGRFGNRTRIIARRNGYAPRACWDDDSINDASAIPQYTGQCGTENGYKLHARENDKHYKPEGIDNLGRPLTAQWVIGCAPCRAARMDARNARLDIRAGS